VEEFRAACEELGRELARREQTLIVGGQSKNTADWHVVNGVVSVRGNSGERHAIEVVRPEYDRDAYSELARQYPKLFSFPPRSSRNWGETHLWQIRTADAVITIGGGDGTYLAGVASIVAEKILVPIGCFGGASERLLGIMRGERTTLLQELDVLNGPWTAHTLETAVRLLGVNRQPRLLIIHGHSVDRFILVDWLRTKLGFTDLLVMQGEFGGGMSLPEKFEHIASEADGAIAIATPDDVGGIVDGKTQAPRARQNVWVEIGWIWGRLGRGKVLILTKGSLELPSDLQGLEYYSYRDSPLETSESIRNFARSLVSRA
jgi:hypothetical protein